MIVFEQDEFLAAIDCSANVRYETINPYIERAFRKIQMRGGGPGSGSSGSLTGSFSGQLV